MAALEKAGRSWRIACTSGSFNGLYAATRAGLGVGVHSARLIPPGLVRLPFSDSLPELDFIEFVALGPGGANRSATTLIEAMLAVTPPPPPPPPPPFAEHYGDGAKQVN